MERASELEGPVPAELRADADSPRMHTIEALLLGNDLAVVFLMTNKPGWTGTAAAVAGGLAVTAIVVARGTARRREFTAVAH